MLHWFTSKDLIKSTFDQLEYSLPVHIKRISNFKVSSYKLIEIVLKTYSLIDMNLLILSNKQSHWEEEFFIQIQYDKKDNESFYNFLKICTP